MKQQLTQSYLKELFDYNSTTGVFTWKISRGNQYTKKGSVAGSSDSDRIKNGTPDYLRIEINGIKYRCHRLAWLYTYGIWPKKTIDHINGIGSDNRIVNLRDVSHSINQKNKKRHKNNKSGMSGVTFNKNSQTWISRIQANGKSIFLGSYTTLYAACYARHFANMQYGFHRNHGR